MTRFTRRLVDDEGNILIVAVLITSVAISLALVGVQVAMNSTRSSGLDRQRVLAVNAAEAGVDSAYSAIETAGVNPPCGLPASSVKSGPDLATYTTTITYYDATGNALPCPLNGAVPKQALIKSNAITNVLGGGVTKGNRTMEALVNLAPLNSILLNKAIFADGSLSFDNKTTITGNNGADADVYTNSSYSCANNENFAGSIYAQGSITLSNGCTIAGNMWAKIGINTSSAWNGSVAGYAKAGTGTITLNQGPGTVTGNLYAAGTITYGGCSAGKCFPNNSPGNPPVEPFPIIRGDTATLNQWAAGSGSVPAYNVITDNTCGTIANKINTVYSQASTPTLVSTTCQVTLGSDIVLKNDLAIFTKGGISTGMISVSSSAIGTKHNLHFIVPYDTVASRPCTTPTIDTDKKFQFTDDVDLFIYSPCTIIYRNQSQHIGQIYGGSDVQIHNQFTMQFRPVPVLGVDPTSLPTVSYVPSIVFKRETR
ncbi:MAG: hypothetical protein QOE64_1916 [Frankiales bacterium]|nr:hypothetical protein [Frankiales bacterium]